MDKSALIAALMDNLSSRFIEVRMEAERDVCRHEGASKALLGAAQTIIQLTALVDDDIEKGRYELEVGQRIKSFIARAGTMLMEQSKEQGRNQLIAQGRAQGVVEIVTIARKRKEEEEQKAITLAAAVTAPVSEPGHPGPSLKAQRLAEEKAELEAAKEKAAVVKPKSAPRRSTKSNGVHGGARARNAG